MGRDLSIGGVKFCVRILVDFIWIFEISGFLKTYYTVPLGFFLRLIFSDLHCGRLQNRCHQDYEFGAQITVWKIPDSIAQNGARNIRSKTFVSLTRDLGTITPRIFSPTHIFGFRLFGLLRFVTTFRDWIGWRRLRNVLGCIFGADGKNSWNIILWTFCNRKVQSGTWNDKVVFRLGSGIHSRALKGQGQPLPYLIFFAKKNENTQVDLSVGVWCWKFDSSSKIYRTN